MIKALLYNISYQMIQRSETLTFMDAVARNNYIVVKRKGKDFQQKRFAQKIIQMSQTSDELFFIGELKKREDFLVRNIEQSRLMFAQGGDYKFEIKRENQICTLFVSRAWIYGMNIRDYIRKEKIQDNISFKNVQKFALNLIYLFVENLGCDNLIVTLENIYLEIQDGISEIKQAKICINRTSFVGLKFAAEKGSIKKSEFLQILLFLDDKFYEEKYEKKINRKQFMIRNFAVIMLQIIIDIDLVNSPVFKTQRDKMPDFLTLKKSKKQYEEANQTLKKILESKYFKSILLEFVNMDKDTKKTKKNHIAQRWLQFFNRIFIRKQLLKWSDVIQYFTLSKKNRQGKENQSEESISQILKISHEYLPEHYRKLFLLKGISPENQMQVYKMVLLNIRQPSQALKNNHQLYEEFKKNCFHVETKQIFVSFLNIFHMVKVQVQNRQKIKDKKLKTVISYEQNDKEKSTKSKDVKNLEILTDKVQDLGKVILKKILKIQGKGVILPYHQQRSLRKWGDL